MSSEAGGEIVVPQHKRCETLVEVPTIVVLPPFGEQTQPSVCVQWFGKAEDDRMPEGSQFNFQLMVAHDNINWFGHPERFRVAFLGQVKDWPKPEAAQATADAITEGNLEGWVIWVVSSIAGMKYESGIGPASIATTVILLGDPNCGVITPQSYVNMGVVDEETAKVL